MISVSSSVKNKIINNLAENTLVLQLIGVVNGSETVIDTITEGNIVSESMNLKQTICDGETFKYGGCVASELDIQVFNTEDKQFNLGDLVDKYIKAILTQTYSNGWIYPSQSLFPSSNLFPGETFGSESFVLFFGKIDSAKRSETDQSVREIVAYDPIYLLYKSDIAEVVKDNLRVNNPIISVLVPPVMHFTERMTDIVTSDWNMTGSLYGASLHNYEFEKNGRQMSAGEFLRYCSELTCGFSFYRAFEDKIRLLRYDDSIHGEEIYESYEELITEESPLKTFVGILSLYGGKKIDTQYVIESNKESKNIYYDCDSGQVKKLESDTSASMQETQDYLKSHYYDLTDNLLAWDYSSDHNPDNLQIIQQFGDFFNYSISADTDYTPCRLTVEGRPWVEVGDTITVKVPTINIYGEYLDANGNVVETYAEAEKTDFTTRVFNRTLTGIKALTDKIELKGEI